MLKVAIIGASGYTGVELVRILTNHPQVELVYLTSETYQGQEFSQLYPNLLGRCNLKFFSYDANEAKERADIIFVALTHGQPMKVVPELLDDYHKVIDLSGDFRFADRDIYEKWYKITHLAPQFLGKAVYGLAELNRERIKKTNFVSNPGCYPTSALLGLAPALKQDLVDPKSIIIDAKSGLSGAGRTLTAEVHFAQCGDSVKAYNIAIHKHIPEMEQEMSKIATGEVTVSFTAHLVPMTRGIFTTIYADLKKNLETSEILKIYEEFYRDEVFIKVLAENKYPESKYVAGSNYCHLGIKVDERTQKVIIVSVIDNLVKGAAGQAIQNMNLMCGIEETVGLMSPGMFP